MNTFHFRLDRALAWRRTQLDKEKAEMQRLAAAVAEVDSKRAEIGSAGQNAEAQVRKWDLLDGRDLVALGHFRQYIREQDQRLAGERVACQRKLEEQRAVMLEARRHCRLLEMLREKRLAEWTEAAALELEAFASEAYLAKWPMRKRDSPPTKRALLEIAKNT